MTSWDDIYRNRPSGELGWFEASPSTLGEVRAALGDGASSVIDVGAGASTLVDHLIDAGLDDITLLDLSAEALEVTRQRLGESASTVHFEVADVTRFEPRRRRDLWHDRATYHFLTHPCDRARYRAALAAALASEGQAVIATFGPAGPPMCAGRDVARYSADELAAEFADLLEPIECRESVVGAEGGDQRPYTICRFRRR